MAFSEAGMASLLELQQSFAAALRAPAGSAAGCPVRPVANLDVYRHNAEHQFRNALSLSFPVLLRRVGEDYFRQLAFHYRQKHPSRSGDLHWVGRHFAGFLADHLRGGEYAWLADLAALEWARELASIVDPSPALGADALAGVAPEDLERLVFTLQPSLRLLRSDFPVFSIWRANQHENAPPVDQSLGSEQYMVLSRYETVEVSRVTPGRFSYLSALAGGATLGEAMSAADLDEAALLDGLQFSFAESLVCAIALR
jgi:hypothetical protein